MGRNAPAGPTGKQGHSGPNAGGAGPGSAFGGGGRRMARRLGAAAYRPRNLATVLGAQAGKGWGSKRWRNEKGAWKGVKGITTFSNKMMEVANKIRKRPGKYPGKEKWFTDQVMDKNPKFKKMFRKAQKRAIPAGLFGGK